MKGTPPWFRLGVERRCLQASAAALKFGGPLLVYVFASDMGAFDFIDIYMALSIERTSLELP